jgi:hypothetical protein
MLTYLDTAIGFVVVMLAISLLITIATQMVSALLNHRGSNLLWGLKTLFANVDPGLTHLKNGSGWLADHVLKHCLISDSWFSNSWISRVTKNVPLVGRLIARFQLASAIRSSELVSILTHIADALPTMTPAPNAKAVPSPLSLAADIKDLLNATNRTAQRDLQMVAAAVAGAVGPGGTPGAPLVPPPAPPSMPPAAVPLLGETVNAARTSVGRLEAWFGSMMDRVSQRFAMWMRIWTVVFACLFAFATGLNAVKLVTDIYQNGSLRDTLVGAAQQIGTSATSVLDPQNSLPTKYTAALVGTLNAQGVPIPSPAPVIKAVVDGTDWINKNVPPTKLAAVLQAYDTAVDAATRQFITDNSEAAQKLIQSKVGIHVLRWNWKDFPTGPKVNWKTQALYLLGVLLTAALLSLGAPFWFNSLKSLTNLRPIVASKEQAEQHQ